MSALRKHDTHTPAEQTENGPRHALSAMLDGEATGAETDACLTAMKHDDGLRQQWSDYHLVGDLMRGAAPLPDDFMASFSARLAAEPTVLAPRRRVWPQRVAVASLASFAVWGVVALTGLMPGAPGTAPMAVAPGIQHAAAVSSTPAEGDARFAAYLVAHQEFAPIAVASPYQRVTATLEEPR